jgi:hypothetical protein
MRRDCGKRVDRPFRYFNHGAGAVLDRCLTEPSRAPTDT